MATFTPSSRLNFSAYSLYWSWYLEILVFSPDFDSFSADADFAFSFASFSSLISFSVSSSIIFLGFPTLLCIFFLVDKYEHRAKFLCFPFIISESLVTAYLLLIMLFFSLFYCNLKYIPFFISFSDEDVSLGKYPSLI